MKRNEVDDCVLQHVASSGHGTTPDMYQLRNDGDSSQATNMPFAQDVLGPIDEGADNFRLIYAMFALIREASHICRRNRKHR